MLVALVMASVVVASCEEPRRAEHLSTAPIEESLERFDCDFPMVSSHELRGLKDLVAVADLVALVQLGPVYEIPGAELPDERTVFLAADARVLRPVKGAKVGERFPFYFAARTTNPAIPDQEGELQGLEGYLPRGGDRMVIATTPPDRVGRDLVSPYAFFVDRGGQLDGELAAMRATCYPGEERTLFAEAEGLGTEELLATLDRQVGG